MPHVGVDQQHIAVPSWARLIAKFVESEVLPSCCWSEVTRWSWAGAPASRTPRSSADFGTPPREWSSSPGGRPARRRLGFRGPSGPTRRGVETDRERGARRHQPERGDAEEGFDLTGIANARVQVLEEERDGHAPDQAHHAPDQQVEPGARARALQGNVGAVHHRDIRDQERGGHLRLFQPGGQGASRDLATRVHFPPEQVVPRHLAVELARQPALRVRELPDLGLLLERGPVFRAGPLRRTAGSPRGSAAAPPGCSRPAAACADTRA